MRSAGARPPADIATKLGNHSFRATGITAYLKNGGTLEKAANMCADIRPRYCLSARGLAGLALGAGELSPMLAQGSDRPCKPVAGTTRLITLDRSGARAALSHPCRDVVSGAGAAAGRAQIRSLIAMAQRQSPEIAAFPCVDPVETAADKLSALA